MSNSNVSEVSICNQALSWLGADRIVSLDDPTKRAQLCKENYAYLRDAVIEEAMWTFATVRAMSESNNRDVWDQYYVHNKPNGWAQVFRVYRDVSGDNPNSWIPSENWRMEGNQIVTKDSTVYMWGVEYVSDTGRFSSTFVQALAHRVAAELAMPITESMEHQQAQWQLYAGILDLAKNRDGMQGANEHVKYPGRLTTVRGGLTGRGRFVE